MATSEKPLAQRMDELKRIIAEPTEKERALAELARIETELAAAVEAEATARAKERLVGIKRAHGSVASEMKDDVRRIEEAAKAYLEAVGRLNSRYRQASSLVAEAAALSDRFDLNAPALSRVPPPIEMKDYLTVHPHFAGHARSRPDMESCEHKMRSRRTFREIAGSEGYGIIAAAGLRSFPELTNTQRQVVEARRRAAEQDAKIGQRYADDVEATVEALSLVHESVDGIAL